MNEANDVTRSDLTNIPVSDLESVTQSAADDLRAEGVRTARDVIEHGAATLEDLVGPRGHDAYCDVCVLIGEPTPAQKFNARFADDN